MKRKAYRKAVRPEGYVSAEPKPTAEDLSGIYAERYYQTAGKRKTSYETDYDADEIAHKLLVANLCLYAIDRAAPVTPPAPARLLEVGCGEGFTLAAAKARGWNIEGLDFSRYAIDRFHPELADTVQVGDAFALLSEIGRGQRRYDACILQNVLEHVIDPARMLRELQGCMADGGIIAITVPNDYSVVQSRLLELGHIDSEFWFSPPLHLSYFNIENGPRFAEKHGFKVVDVYASFPVDFFLFHPGSNYVRDAEAGKPIHRARIEIDLLLAKNGMAAFHRWSQAMAACGVGRAFTMLITRA